MGKIFYIMGKSSSGKDTIYSRLLQDSELGLSRIVLYTTRPMREGETEGKEYHFTAVSYTHLANRRRKNSAMPCGSPENSMEF